MAPETNRKPDQSPDPKPTLETLLLGMIVLVIIFSVSAVTGKEVPTIVYAIIAGVIFGIGNIRDILGGGK